MKSYYYELLGVDGLYYLICLSNSINSKEGKFLYEELNLKGNLQGYLLI